jgi:hypothetical protein
MHFQTQYCRDRIISNPPLPAKISAYGAKSANQLEGRKCYLLLTTVLCKSDDELLRLSCQRGRTALK